MHKVEILENGNVKLAIPMSFRNCAGRKRIVTPDEEVTFTDPMVTSLARAFRWQALIDEGVYSNVQELARAIGKDMAYVSRITRFKLLSPEIIPGKCRRNEHRRQNYQQKFFHFSSPFAVLIDFISITRI